MSVNPMQPDGNAVDRLRSRFEAITETTVEQRAIVEQLETVLEILDQPALGSVSQRAHHPSARGRNRRSPKSKQDKSKQDKLQAALSQLLVEQQQRHQLEQELVAAQETVKQLVDLVSRRDRQLVSARHAWDLLKSRNRQAAEELSHRVSELEGTIEKLTVAHRVLESQLAQAGHDAARGRDELSAAAEKLMQAAELASSLEQELARAREEASLMTVRRGELQAKLDQVVREHRSTNDAAREREAILVQQLDEVQLLLKREQECRRNSEQKFQVAVAQLHEARQQVDAALREYVDHESKQQLDKAQLTDGVQALKAELHQLHVERLATNGFIERMFEEIETGREAAHNRERDMSRSCADATLLAESRAEQIARMEVELQSLREEFNLAAASDAARDSELARLRSGTQRAAIMLESQRRQLAEAEHSLAEEQIVATKNADLRAEQDTLIAKIQAKVDLLQTTLQREAAGRRKAESRVKAGCEDGTGVQMTIEDAEQKIDQLSDELAAFKKLAKALKQKGSQKMRLARAEIARLKAQIESLSSRQV